MRRTVFLVWLMVALGCDDGTVNVVMQPKDDGAVAVDATADVKVIRADQGAEPDAAPDMAIAPDAAAPDGGAPDGAIEVDAAATDLGADAAPSDAATADDAAPDGAQPDQGEADAAPPGEGLACEACERDADCGEGFLCSDVIGGRVCLADCAGGGACDEGFGCLFDRCQPAGGRCDSCAVAGCEANERCNVFTGNCEEFGDRCDGCNADVDCAEGRLCRQLGLVRVCLDDCALPCSPGFSCEDNVCAPDNGICDACGGCEGDRPVCNAFSRVCLACGPGFPCEPGRVCDAAGECVAPDPGVDCLSDLDCREEARPTCHEGGCVLCRDDAGCGLGEQCIDGLCEPAPVCFGVACQDGSECDPESGRCAPGCAADEDCGDERLCNVDTGQCYRADQRCDLMGMDAVCAPGSACQVDPFNMMRGNCVCARTDPANIMEPPEDYRIPCQPGGACLQFGAQPGVCVDAP